MKSDSKNIDFHRKADQMQFVFEKFQDFDRLFHKFLIKNIETLKTTTSEFFSLLCILVAFSVKRKKFYS